MRVCWRLHLLWGVTPGTGDRDPVLRPGGGAGRPAPRKALIVRPRPGGGPLGRGARWLRRREAGRGAGGSRPGESAKNQEEHAGPAAPQRDCFLPQFGSKLSTSRSRMSSWNDNSQDPSLINDQIHEERFRLYMSSLWVSCHLSFTGSNDESDWH